MRSKELKIDGFHAEFPDVNFRVDEIWTARVFVCVFNSLCGEKFSSTEDIMKIMF